MTDKITSRRRSWNMSRIRSSNTIPELIVRSMLHRIGFRFRVNSKDIVGKPDIVLPKYRTVIFIHGCFWHQHLGCKEASRPTSNRKYWNAKLQANVQRDYTNRCILKREGWHVLRLWECEVEKNPKRIAMRIAKFLGCESKGRAFDVLPSRQTILKAAQARAQSIIKPAKPKERP